MVARRPAHAVAWAVALVLALPASAKSVVDVALGFEGHVRPGEHAHLRIDVDNPGNAETLTLRLRQDTDPASGQEWELAIDAPSHSRRTHFLTFRPSFAVSAGLAWSVDNAKWRVLPGLVTIPGDGVALVVAVTSRGQSFPQLRASVDPQGRGVLRVASVTPEHAPTEPAAWSAADVILVDVEAATRLVEPAWRAIEDRVLVGATLIVHGAELGAGAPASLLAGHAGEATVVPFGPSMASLPARRVEAAPGARPVVADGAPVTWATTRRHGLGRVVTAGVNLHDVAPPAGSAEPWLGLLEVADTDHVASLHRRSPRLPEVVRDSGGGQQGLRASALLMLGCVALLVGVAAAVAAVIVSRDPRYRHRVWWLLPAGCALLSLPALALGLGGRLLERDAADFVVEEVFAATGRRRVTTFHGPWSDGDVPTVSLSSWPASVATSASAVGPGTLVAGARPRARGFRATLGSPVAFECERWDDAPVAFEVTVDDEVGRRVRNLSSHHFVGAAGAFDGTNVSFGPLGPQGEVTTAGAADLASSRRRPRPHAEALGDALPTKVVNALNAVGLDADVLVAARGGGAFGLRARGAERVVVVYLPRTAP